MERGIDDIRPLIQFNLFWNNVSKHFAIFQVIRWAVSFSAFSWKVKWNSTWKLRLVFRVTMKNSILGKEREKKRDYNENTLLKTQKRLKFSAVAFLRVISSRSKIVRMKTFISMPHKHFRSSDHFSWRCYYNVLSPFSRDIRLFLSCLFRDINEDLKITFSHPSVRVPFASCKLNLELLQYREKRIQIFCFCNFKFFDESSFRVRYNNCSLFIG